MFAGLDEELFDLDLEDMGLDEEDLIVPGIEDVDDDIQYFNPYKRSVRIPQIDAKDLYMTNHSVWDGGCSSKLGYSIRNGYGQYNLRRFKATIDYSLELLKLREVYNTVYGTNGFSERFEGKDFSRHVVSVTFKFSVRRFNLVGKDIYIRNDVDMNDAEFEDCLWVKNGAVVGVLVNHPFVNQAESLPSGFGVADGAYITDGKFGTVCSSPQLREMIYRNGFNVDGIHFVRYKRSAGSSRVGKCLFIDEKLYPLIHEWEMCGLQIEKDGECDLAGIESYISLTMSSIIGAIEIKPENILLVEDYESVFKDDAIVVREVDGHLVAQEDNVEVTNSIWDGQSLIDKSLLCEYDSHGFVLLRNNFFKSAAFNCNMQQWFKDNGVTDVAQLNGKTIAKRIEDVKYIVTPSSIKYMKYGTFEKWLENIGSVFGVVKYEKRTHFFGGERVQVHYQLLNSLQMSMRDVEELMQPTIDYVRRLKNDVSAVRTHIRFNIEPLGTIKEESLSSKSRIVYKLLGVNDAFAKTKMYNAFVSEVTTAFIADCRLGHIMVNGNYSTMVGNPIEMLRHAIGKFDGTSQIGIGNIHSKRFEYNTTLLGTRSPQPASGNLLLAKNAVNDEIDRYMNMTTEIVAVNSIGENLLFRLSGADFDSDTILLTDNMTLIKCAAKNYTKFKVPTAEVSAKKRQRKYNEEDKASLDTATKTNAIGQIVNLSSELNTYIWQVLYDTNDWDRALEIYKDVALLSSLSNIAIDSAKREFSINCIEELQRIRQKYIRLDEDGKRILPLFFAYVSKKKGYYDSEHKNYKFHHASMDYIQKVLDKTKTIRKSVPVKERTTLSGMLTPVDSDAVDEGIVNLVICMVRALNEDCRQIWLEGDESSASDKYDRVNTLRTRCEKGISSIYMNTATMAELIRNVDDDKNSDIRKKLMDILFSTPNSNFFELLRSSAGVVGTYNRVEIGEKYDILMMGLPYKKVVNA